MRRFLLWLCHGAALLALAAFLGCSHWQQAMDPEEGVPVVQKGPVEPTVITVSADATTPEPPLAGDPPVSNTPKD
jgi:hypothetical protein